MRGGMRMRSKGSSRCNTRALRSRLARLDRAAPGIHVLPSSVTSLTPGGQVRDLGDDVVERPDTSSPRRVGHDQKLQYLLQPSMIETKSRGALDARRRQVIEFLDPGADVRPGAGAPAALSSSSGSRGRVCGPNTTSTIWRAPDEAGPSWLATQRRPRSSGRLCALQVLDRPRSANSFSCAFSRT